MNSIIVMLAVFVALGLARTRLGRLTYPLMAVVILVYVTYAFITG